MNRRNTKRLYTTTWPERHAETFAELATWLETLDIIRPRVLHVGPGAVSACLRNRLAAGEGHRLSWPANRWRAVLRNIDSIIRHIPAMPLHSYEPGELQKALPQGSKLIVADINRRVIDAVSSQYPNLETRVLDFATEIFTPQVDVIVCLCVLVRTDAAKHLFANLYSSLKPAGLMVMDNRSVTNFSSHDTPLDKLAGQIWRKTTVDAKY